MSCRRPRCGVQSARSSWPSTLLTRIRYCLWRQLEAQLNVYRMHARQLMEEITLHAGQTVPRFDPIEVPAEDAARMVRMQWRMPIGPVRDLVRWLEAAGCLVVVQDFGTARVDGMSQWVDDLPVMLVNERTPTDRLRLTLAHELGHLCLHSVEITKDLEGEANAFAAEFLMPTEAIRFQLLKVSPARLHDIKREWGVSMQALIEKAHTIGQLRAAERTRLYKTFSANGWRTREPCLMRCRRRPANYWLRSLKRCCPAASVQTSSPASLDSGR